MKTSNVVTTVVFLTTLWLAFGQQDQLTCRPCKCVLFHDRRLIEMYCQIGLEPTKPLPKPPKKAKHISTAVYFDDNTIPELTAAILSPLTAFNIVSLSFQNNSLENITRDAFSDLKYLHTLDLSQNPISENVLKESFHGMSLTRLKVLNISAMHGNLRNISQEFFKNLENIPNFILIFQNNTENVFPMEQFMNLHLEKLYFGSNGLKKFDVQSAYFPDLKNLNLDNNYFIDFPDFCFGNDSSFRFPSLQNLSVQWNGMRYLNPDHYGCLNLTHFFLNGNLFIELKSNQFAMLSYLYKITLSYVACAMKKVERAVFNNSALKQIFFRENHLWFRNAEVDLRMFEGCSSLELLNLNDNVFQVTTKEEFRILLQDLKTLKVLVMGRCSLSFIPPVITEELTNIESLALYKNSIPDLPEHTFDNLTKLRKLFMSANQITVIKETSLPQHFINQALDVEFVDNPFSCTCELLWFIQWMRRSENSKNKIFKLKQNHYYDKYNCSTPDNRKGQLLMNLDMSEASCLLDPWEKILTLTSGILIIVFLVVGSALYRFRWHIRYLVYMIRYSHRQELDMRHYEYDAFVAYSTEDRRWVIRTLLPVIEARQNLKLCVHDRDFEVGKLIVDNIVDGIEKSRKVMIVLSNNFAKSDWCQFELNLIQRHVLENGQRLLVVVMLEEIETRHVTKAMRVMLQTTTYLLWGEEDYARKAFFNRLRMLLQKPTRKGKRRLSV